MNVNVILDFNWIQMLMINIMTEIQVGFLIQILMLSYLFDTNVNVSDER